MTYIVRYLITYGVYGVYGYDNCVAPECVHGQKRARCGCAYFIFVGPQRVRMHLMVLPGFCGIEWHTTSVSPLSTSTETFVSCSLLFSLLCTTNIRSTPVSPLHNTDCSIVYTLPFVPAVRGVTHLFSNLVHGTVECT